MADGPAAALDAETRSSPTTSRPNRRCSARCSSTTTSTTASRASCRPAHFYDPVHARIFEVAGERIKKNALASPVTLKAFFEDDDGLRELGGPAYLARLAGAAISLFAAKDYAQLVYDLAIRRELIVLGQEHRRRRRRGSRSTASRATRSSRPSRRSTSSASRARSTRASRASCAR